MFVYGFDGCCVYCVFGDYFGLFDNFGEIGCLLLEVIFEFVGGVVDYMCDVFFGFVEV